MSKVFDAMAIGGPLDGKRVTHYAPIYKTAELSTVVNVRYDHSVLTDDLNITQNVFTYEYFQYVDFAAWVPREVIEGKSYAHKIWKHPMDYILNTLAAHYRPEGY